MHFLNTHFDSLSSEVQILQNGGSDAEFMRDRAKA